MGDESGTRFGRMLRGLRQARGLTIEELAETSGVSGRAIGDMERGRSLRPQRGTVTAIAQGLALDEAAHAELLAVARGGRTGSRPRAAVAALPCALPRGVRDFVGRRAELAVLRGLAHRPPPDRTGGSASSPPVAVVFGAPGSGKTSLAVQLAEQLAPELADGAFLLDMQGLDARPLSPQEAVVRLLGAWGAGDLDLVQLSPEERLARYQEVAGRLRGLLVLDNAGHESQVRPLLPREGRLLVVVTSRHTMAGLEGVQRVELPVLDPLESGSLLRAVVGAGRVDAEPDAARTIAELCGHLPLAVRVAANWAATRTNWSLQRLAVRLTDEDRRLDSLSAGDLRVNSAFSLSYSRLAPGAARMFRLLSLVPAPDFGLPLAAVLARVPLFDAEDLLEELLEAGLLTTHRDDRYRLHDLLRLYARAQLRQEEGGAAAETSRSRLRAWLLDTAVTAGRWHEPGYGAPPPDPGRLVALEDPEQAMGWLKAEYANWLAAFREAAGLGEHGAVNEVGRALGLVSDNWVSAGHWTEVFETAARAAAALGEPAMEAGHLNDLSWALWVCEGAHPDADAAAAAALDLARTCGDQVQQARAHLRLSVLRDAVGDASSAADHCRRAMDLFIAADEITRYLPACNVNIRLLHRAGRNDEAVATHREVMEVLADPRNAERIPESVRGITALVATYHVSLVHLNLGQWAEAVDALRPLRGQLDARGYHRVGAKLHLHLAHALAHLGESGEAAAEYRAVLALEERIPADLVEQARAGVEGLGTGRLTPPTVFD
ncbi:XRE family transcriptional regulator [Kitasatospora cineracea]|uniref:NB-ARC domain-containing protein n=1 Tax=Kitasatospora cineracea TaxID=88074 RepID=A0A3N4REX6_9ACTN|nr:XRE family transcriptional regulator [Kitasatospora cineracea]RPE31862.1 NB-ARC domain-containing protein [Kitasatospora cineracea]